MLLNSPAIDEVFINLNYLSEKVESFLIGRNDPYKIIKLNEDVLLGTAGTIKNSYEFFRDQPLIVIHADNLSQFDLNLFIKAFDTRKQGIEITMMTFLTDEPKNCGIVELDPDGLVVGFHEKSERPYGNLANGAVYIISPGVIDFIHHSNEYINDFSTQVIPNFVGRINTYHNAVYHRDIGTCVSLDLAQTEFKLFLSNKF